MNPMPQAVLFDAYGTLFDVHSVAVAADAQFPGHGRALSALWREKQIDYSRLVSMSGRWQPFDVLTRAALRTAALHRGLVLTATAEDALMRAYDQLQPFAENAAVLAALRGRGVRCGVLSNGTPAMLAAAVASAGFTSLLDPVLSVAAARRYKTDPAAYALGPAALGLPASDILFVSSNHWDAIGATWYGFRTLWVNRSGAPPEQLGTESTHTGTDLGRVLELVAPASLP